MRIKAKTSNIIQYEDSQIYVFQTNVRKKLIIRFNEQLYFDYSFDLKLSCYNLFDLNEANALLNKYLCNFIANKFLQSYHDQNGITISQNKYANLCGLSSSTLTKLKEPEGYDIPMTTLYNICRHEQYSLKKFFTEFEELYGLNIPQ